MKRRAFIAVVFCLLFARTAVCAEKYDPADLAKKIEPFLDESTLFVAHVDMTKADPAPVAAKVKEMMMKIVPQEQQAEGMARFEKDVNVGRQWMADFTKAGANDYFAVISMSGFPDFPIYAIVPLKKGANGEAIAKLLNGDVKTPGSAHAEVRGNVVVWGTPKMLDSLKTLKAQARPELAKAFEAAGDSAAQLLIVPSADTRKVLIELAPAMPAGPLLDAKDPITRGIVWAGIGVKNLPDLEMNVVIQSPDADAAKLLGDTVTRLVGIGKQMISRELANVPQVAAMIGDLDVLAKGFTPTVAGDRVTFHLDTNQSLIVSGVMLPAIARARMQASQSVSMSNMKQILLGCIMYAEDHKEFPPDIQTLMKGRAGLPPQVFKQPQMPQKEIGYTYLQPVKAAPANQVILYEAWDTPPARIAVGFADGHVESMEYSSFEKVLAQSKARNEAKQ